MQMNHDDLKNQVYQTAVETAGQGYGWAQERVVVREVARRLGLGPDSVSGQQAILTAWHDLFREGKLSWGFDVDNPNAPFFHVARRDPRAAPETPALAGTQR
jgi:hypothetical protein